jgi:hypothetical protein
MKNHTNINPSFFGRLYAIDASFATIAEEIRKDGIRAERGDNHYYRNVSDTLDLLELLFLYGKHPDLLIEHFSFPHIECEWGRMMEKDLMVDQQLERHAKDWILFSWKGKLIGGTSPYTLVYTVPDIRNRNIQLPGGQGRLLFDDQNLLLSKRDLRFQQYMVSLYRYHNLPSSMHSYLKEIEKLLTHHPVIHKEDFDSLPEFTDIPGAVVNDITLKCDPSITYGQETETLEKHATVKDDNPLKQHDKRIFISYKRKDKELVCKLLKTIEDGLEEKCWIDLEGIRSDAQFASVIINAIDKADVFLFMFSKTHTAITDFERDWTIRELTYAQSSNKRIVFVNIDGTELIKYLTFMFPNKQQVDATSPAAIQKLLCDLRGWLR